MCSEISFVYFQGLKRELWGFGQSQFIEQIKRKEIYFVYDSSKRKYLACRKFLAAVEWVGYDKIFRSFT